MNRRKLLPLLLFASIVIIASSCAPEAECAADIAVQKQYGFFSGFFHGLLVPIAVISKMIGLDVGIYAVNNTGFLYWLGYLIGLGGLGGGAYSGTRRRK